MRFTTLIAKNLFCRGVRTALTVLGLGVGVSSVVSMLGMSWGFETSFLAIYQSKGIDLIVVKGGAGSNLTSYLPAEMEAEIRKIPGVKNVVGSLFDTVSMDKGRLASVLVNGWVPGSQMFQGIRIIDGRALAMTDEKAVLVGRVLAINLGTKVGDSLDISHKKYAVVGIYESDSLFENGGLVVTLEEQQRRLNRKGYVGGLVVSAEKSDPSFVRDLGRQIEAKLEDVAASPAIDFVQQESQIKLVKAMSWATSIIAMALGSIFVLNTMMMTVFERTKEIGILRALGWRRRRILELILGESMMLGVAGAFVGALLAYFGVKLVAQFPMTRLFINPDLPPIVLLYGIGLGIGLSVFSGLYPAIRASSLDPTEALRHE